MKSDYFKRFSFLVERYPIEVFTFEILLGIIIEPTFRFAFLLFAGVFLTATVSESMKFIFKEKRPEEALRRDFYKKNFKLNRRSFPSSHSAVVAFFPTVFFGSILFIPFLLFALLVMYSRLYIKSHHPRDVIAGAFLGVFIGLFLVYLIDNLRI